MIVPPVECGGSLFNATRIPLDRAMEEFVYDMAFIHEFEIPMYYFRFGVSELNSGVLVSFETIVEMLTSQICL